MARFKLIGAVIGTSGMAAVFCWLNSSSDRLRRENLLLRETIVELQRLQTVHESAEVGGSLTLEKLDELASLRSEVVRLRGQTNQIGVLVDANQKLAATLREMNVPRAHQRKHAEEAPPQDIHQRSSWAFRGYATPEATIESYFWGELNGNKGAMLGAFSAADQPKFERGLEGKDLARRGSEIKSEDFRISDRRQISEDEIVLTIYTSRHAADGHLFYNDFQPFVMQRIGGEWKIADKPAPDD